MRSFSPRLTTRRVPPWMAWALLAATVFLALPALWAQAGDVATTAVVRFQDRTGRNSSLLEGKATDAVALALADSREYLVTPAREVDREVQSLGFTPPVSVAQAVRLGTRLDVDTICIGDISQASVDSRTGRGEVQIQIIMVDVEAAEFLDGATITTATPGIPGWSGTEADILNEAIRQAAEEAVTRMLATRVRRGTVEAVLPSGACETNLGSQDGASTGMKLVVMRPVYLRELETVTLRKIGYMEVASTQPDLCYADPVGSVAPRTGDYVLRVYEPFVVVKAAAAKADRIKFLWGIAALGLLAGLAGIATGGNEGTMPPTPISYLYQDAPGKTPVIRVEMPGWDKAFGHLLYRGPSSNFAVGPFWLVEVFTRGFGTQTVKLMDDLPDFADVKDITITVNFRDESGDQAQETIDCSFIHPALVAGETYFHRVQRGTKPQFPPGTNPPIATGGGTEQVAQTQADNTIDQSGQFPMLSTPSFPAGPVTYITFVQGLTIDGDGEPAPQSPSGPIVFGWQATTGADEYMVEVFPATDRDGTGLPIFRREGIRATGIRVPPQVWNPAAGDLQENSTFFWRVGARKSSEVGGRRGQGVPRVGAPGIRGFVLSAMESFQTTFSPPPPPTSSGEAVPAAKQTGKQAAQAKPAKGGSATKPRPARGRNNAGPRPARPAGGWGAAASR